MGYFFIENDTTFEIEAWFHEFGNPKQKWKVASISQRIRNADPQAYIKWKFEVVPRLPLGKAIEEEEC